MGGSSSSRLKAEKADGKSGGKAFCLLDATKWRNAFSHCFLYVEGDFSLALDVWKLGDRNNYARQ